MGFPRMSFHFSPSVETVRAGIRKTGDSLRDEFTKDLIASGYADDLANIMRARVRQRGLDIKGRPFKPYSASHSGLRRELGLKVSPPDLTISGQLWDAVRGDVVKGDPVVTVGGRISGGRRPFGLGGRNFSRGPRTNDLLMLFHQEGTRPPRRRGTGLLSARQRTGSRRRGGRGGIPARAGFGLTPGERTFAISVANQLFQLKTFPRLARFWTAA